MTERQRIIATFSPAEREIYERIGGTALVDHGQHVGKQSRAMSAKLREVIESVQAERYPRAFVLARLKREREAAA